MSGPSGERPAAGASGELRAGAPPRPGFPYELVRELGKGGMGAVWEVRKPGDARRLAAKFLILSSAQARARFQREGEVVARLEHPGIVPVLASGARENGEPYLIFEFVEGRSLKAILEQEERLPEARVLELGEELARALGHAHAHGVVHRDVKPDNILIEKATGRVRVADFGIAHAEDMDRLTKTGQITGTVLYMAKEQLAHDGRVGPWTDVHAIGAVLFEALAGQAPFCGETTHNVIAQILNAEPPSVRTFRPDASVAIAAVIARCLEKEPDQRYPDGEALAEDLAAVRRGDSVSAVGTFFRAARKGLRRRATAGACVGFVVLGAIGGGAAYVARDRRALARERGASELAGDLDQLLLQVRQSGPSEKVQERILRARARVDDALAGLDDPAARARVEQALAALDAELARAQALAAATPLLRGGPAPEVAALAAALAAFERVPAPGDGELTPEARAFEEARGRVLASAGRLEAAAVALRRASVGDVVAPAADAVTWLADPAARRAWHLAWTELRSPGARGAGDAQDELLARLAAAPPACRASFALCAAAIAAEGPAATAALERARAEAGRARGPDGALVAAAASVEALRRRLDAPHGEVRAALLELRRLSDPPSPSKVPADVQVAASLLEGDLLLRLGWPAAAQDAFERAAAAGMSEASAWPVVPMAPAGEVGPAWLVSPGLAASLGRARAAALRDDGDAALASATDAIARAELDQPPRTLALARTLEADARALAGRDAPPDPDTGDLPRVALRLHPDLGPSATLAAEGATELWIAARREPGSTERTAGLARARRALRLARRLGRDDDPTLQGRAAAALARCEVARGELPAAVAAADEASRLAPHAWQTHEALAHLRIAQGRPAEAVAALESLEAALASLRAVERAELSTRTLMSCAGLLIERENPVEALRVLELAAGAAVRDRLPVGAQVEAAEQLGRLASTLQRDDVLRIARGRFEEAQAQQRRLALLGESVGKAQASLDELQDTPELRRALRALLTEAPLDPTAYISSHVLYGRLRAEGFDNLALGFEVLPDRVLDYLNSNTFSPHGMPESQRGAMRASLALLVERVDVDPTLPNPRDDDLRVAVAGLYALDLGATLRPEVFEAACRKALEAVVRRPTSRAAAVAHGRLRLALGDFAGATEWLARARGLPGAALVTKRCAWLSFYEAEAAAARRRWPDAQAALTRAVEEGLPYAYRITDEPLFREDRALQGTLPPWAAAIVKDLEQRYGTFDGRPR